MDFHLVSKSDNKTHTTISLDKSSYPDLSTDFARIQPVVISLTSNNLSYARYGELLRWWDAYPVPQAAPAPYNDNRKWGIVPAWGFGIVTESTIASLEVGTVLFGFWPTSSAPVDLKLSPSDPVGHWVERSTHRENMMSIYNEYRVIRHHEIPSGTTLIDFPEEELENMAWMSLFSAVWQTGYLLSAYTFPSSSETNALIGPMGTATPWSPEDADLSETVLVSVSASGKTARGFAWQVLTKRSHQNRPLGFLQITQAPETIGQVAVESSQDSGIPTKAYGYSELESAVAWMASLKPKKVVFVDFGARENSFKTLHDLVGETPELKEAKSVIIHVGGEQKVYSPEELQATIQEMISLDKLRCNTAGMKDALTASIGEQAYQEAIQSNWNEFINDRKKTIPDLKLVWSNNVSGDDGIYGGWDRVTRGAIAPHECLVFRFR